MSERYIAFKLSQFDVMTVNDITKLNENVQCCITKDWDTMMDFLNTVQSQHSFAALQRAIPLPEVYVIGRIPEDSRMQQDPLYIPAVECVDTMKSYQMSFSDDTLHGRHVLVGIGTLSDLYTDVRTVAFERGNTMAECAEAQQKYPNVYGIDEWFRAIVATNPEYNVAMPDAEHHTAVYAQTYQNVFEQSKDKSGQVWIMLQAIEKAATTLAEQDVEFKQWYQEVATNARISMREYYDEVTLFMNPQDYLTRMMPAVPDEYQEAMLNAFNEEFSKLAEKDWDRARITVNAFNNAVHTILNEVADSLTDGKVKDTAKRAELTRIVSLLAELHNEAQITADLVNDLSENVPEEPERDDAWDI